MTFNVGISNLSCRYTKYKEMKQHIIKTEGSLVKFAQSYEKYGVLPSADPSKPGRCLLMSVQTPPDLMSVRECRFLESLMSVSTTPNVGCRRECEGVGSWSTSAIFDRRL